MPVQKEITGLSWDETTEAHIHSRLATDDLEDFIEHNQFFVFPNTKNHPPGRYKLIGRMPSGVIWTVILEEAADGDPSQWKPITSWRSTNAEAQKFQNELARRNRKGRR